MKGFAEFSLNFLSAERVEPDGLSFLICGKSCRRACVGLEDSELSESAGFQGIFVSALCFVDSHFVARGIGNSVIIVFCSMKEDCWI